MGMYNVDIMNYTYITKLILDCLVLLCYMGSPYSIGFSYNIKKLYIHPKYID